MRTGTLLPLLLLAAAAAGCASADPGRDRSGPIDPRTMVPPGIRPEWLHFADPTVAPGEIAPDFTLPTPDGGTLLSLSTFQGRPLVLVFGSYT
jgi:hypothetical protein